MDSSVCLHYPGSVHTGAHLYINEEILKKAISIGYPGVLNISQRQKVTYQGLFLVFPYLIAQIAGKFQPVCHFIFCFGGILEQLGSSMQNIKICFRSAPSCNGFCRKSAFRYNLHHIIYSVEGDFIFKIADRHGEMSGCKVSDIIEIPCSCIVKQSKQFIQWAGRVKAVGQFKYIGE